MHERAHVRVNIPNHGLQSSVIHFVPQKQGKAHTRGAQQPFRTTSALLRRFSLQLRIYS